MAKRDIKRVFIFFVYLVLLALVLLALYFKLKKDPSCFDGKQNQGEAGVDCGGPCVACSEIIKLEPLEIRSVEWVHDTEKKYDVIASVRNPNDSFGGARFLFRANIVDQESQIIDQSNWTEGYILPGETKYLMLQSFETDAFPVDNISKKVVFEIDTDGIKWERFKNFEEPNLIVNNSRYEQIAGAEVGFGRAVGTIINKSAVDFEVVKVNVLLRDDFGNLLATNSQIMNTLRAGEVRDYVIVFPRSFIGSVADVEVRAESNPFDSENYIRVHGTPARWNEN